MEPNTPILQYLGKWITMKNLTSKIVLGSAVLALGTATVMCTWAQAQKDLAKDSSTRSYKIEVSGAKGWVDTDIDVLAAQSCASMRPVRLHIRPTNPTVENCARQERSAPMDFREDSQI